MTQQLWGVAMVATLLFTASCKPAHNAMIVGANYDGQKDQTVLTLLPYGSVNIPGKWAKTGYDATSKQHFFTNTDSTIISATINPQNKYPFYKSTFTDISFTSEFVKWDTTYWGQKGLTTKILEDKADKGYILWHVNDSANKFVKTIFLYGGKRNMAYNFSGSSKTWSEEKIQNFLTELFKNN